MAELNTPVHFKRRKIEHSNGEYVAFVVFDRELNRICECDTEDEARAIVAAVNRDAVHAATVRRLTEIIRGLLLWHDGGEPAEWTPQQSVDDLHKHLVAARTAIAAAEGGGT